MLIITLESAPRETNDNADMEKRRNSRDSNNPAYLNWRRDELHSRSTAALDGKVPAAAAWIQIDGQGLYEKEGEKQNETRRKGSLWSGPMGWSKSRFAFWRERFDWISTVSTLQDVTREPATQAAETMRRLEVQH